MKITVSQEIKQRCPEFAGVAVSASVRNTSFSEALWAEIDAFVSELLTTTTLDNIKNHPAIAATREAYKKCGKDPGRYRPSALGEFSFSVSAQIFTQWEAINLPLLNLCVVTQEINSS